MPICLEEIVRTPPMRRLSMVYHPLDQRMITGQTGKAAALRRMALFLLVIGSTWCGAGMFSEALSSHGPAALRDVIIGIFTVLFGWISITLWTALIGFCVLMRRRWMGGRMEMPGKEIPISCRVALVMPVYNEDPQRVFAGLRVMYESLEKTGKLGHFDFFVLSDSTQAAVCQQEEMAWANLCDQLNCRDRIFYRHRKIRIHKKSGNISDFCRRWGSQYKYMMVLDADSLISGPLMVEMTKAMESRLDIGILQTAPKGFNQKSLLARLNQFACHLYGPLLLAGAHFVQQDEAGFWGHNAIVRLEPFMKYCALPKLSGSPPFGGEILSHDFIEAALMRRAGWGVWLADAYQDSYEELPPDLKEELERDRRWCRGNLQHLRLMLMKGISFGHRFLFFNGNMFYFSALLWLLLLVLMTAYSISGLFARTQYFSGPHRLFPDWPVHYNHLSMELLAVTGLFLFLPKFLSVVWVLLSGNQRFFGGPLRLLLSVILETVFSVFLAPIRMVFHSWFLAAALAGGKLDWKRQQRSHQKLSFKELVKSNWLISLMAMGWGWMAFEADHTLFLWLSAIVLPLCLCIPLQLLMSWPKAGEFFKILGLFNTPAETKPSSEIMRLKALLK